MHKILFGFLFFKERNHMLLRLFIIIASTMIFNLYLAASPVTRVMKHNLGSYAWEDEEWPNEPFGDYLNRCMKYQSNMQPFKKCRAAWNILDRYYENVQAHSNHVVGNDELTWQNLQLLRSEQEADRSEYVANLVDRTSTEIGRVTLRAWIAQPIDDCQELLKRQSFARFLVEHEELFNKLNTHFLAFKKSENFFMSFWINDPLKQAAGRSYFKLSRLQSAEDFLNENPTALTMATALENQRRILCVLTTAFATAVLPSYGISRLMYNPNGSRFDNLAERLIGSGGPIFSLISYIDNRYIQAAGFITAGMYCGISAQDQYDWARDNFTLNMCLQTKLHHVANCLNALEAIGNTLQKYPELNFADDKDIHALMQHFKAAQSTTDKLYTLLKNSTFKGKSTHLAHWGKILVAYRLVHKHIEDLEPLLCAFGELDAYMSIARLYKEFEHNRVHYTFASYIPISESPTIMFNDLWSPFIDPSYVVPNSIALGMSPAIQNLVITGPNEGGKSTFVKSVAIGLILAQSIGIVPASQAKITPFSYISTYLNITDDHGKSLFEAQVQRAKHLLDHIDRMGKNKYSFVIIDELFNGTDARVGQATSYSIADYLSKNPQVISIFPTHFPELTRLEQNGHSVNYKVSATIDDEGKISYPFAIEPGASKQNIVLDIMRNEGFNSAIIDQATQLLKPAV